MKSTYTASLLLFCFALAAMLSACALNDIASPTPNVLLATPLGYPGRLVVRNADWHIVLQKFAGVDMVLVPAGCFNMGINPGDAGDSDLPVESGAQPGTRIQAARRPAYCQSLLRRHGHSGGSDGGKPQAYISPRYRKFTLSSMARIRRAIPSTPAGARKGSQEPIGLSGTGKVDAAIMPELRMMLANIPIVFASCARS